MSSLDARQDYHWHRERSPGLHGTAVANGTSLPPQRGVAVNDHHLAERRILRDGVNFKRDVQQDERHGEETRWPMDVLHDLHHSRFLVLRVRLVVSSVMQDVGSTCWQCLRWPTVRKRRTQVLSDDRVRCNYRNTGIENIRKHQKCRNNSQSDGSESEEVAGGWVVMQRRQQPTVSFSFSSRGIPSSPHPCSPHHRHHRRRTRLAFV